MSIDPNTPVLLGAGQFTERLDDNFEGLMPADFAARACEVTTLKPSMSGLVLSVAISFTSCPYSVGASIQLVSSSFHWYRFPSEGIATGASHK